MLAVALFTNFLMLIGTIYRATLLFLPWMLFYGLELLASWSVALAFILLPGKNCDNTVTSRTAQRA